jgi:ABC-type sulfate/molybdate transport systems ATPase subunit
MSAGELSVLGLSHRYGGGTVLNDIAFTIRKGETLALLGASGSGKSTVLRLIAGLEAPSQGRIALDDAPWSVANVIVVPPHERGIGMVFQDLALWPALSVLDNAALGLAARMGRRDARERARHALAICGIEALAPRRPAELSGGQQQRVALARALAARPQWLLLDEPFGGLDLLTREVLVRDITTLVATLGTTLVLVTHDPIEAVGMCERAVVLEAGRVAETGSLPALLQAPTSALMSAFREAVHRNRLP